MHPKALLINEKDNVATALTLILKGNVVCIWNDDGPIAELRAMEDIPLGHKIAIRQITKGQYIVKYGNIIGVASSDIGIGHHVHVHNVRSLRGRSSLRS